MAKTIDTKIESDTEAERSYATPRLVVYGAMEELTAGGSGMMSEAMAGGGMNTMRQLFF